MKNYEYAKESLKLCCNGEVTDPSAIKDLDSSSIMKIKSYLLECFVRLRSKIDIAEKWKAPIKGNKEKMKKEKAVNKLDNHL